MAVISFYWIEAPFRRPDDAWPRRRIFRWGGMAIGSALACAFALVALRGVPQRFDTETRAIIAANEIYRAQQGTGTGCGHWHDDIHDIAHVARCTYGADKPRKILFWGDSHLEVLQKSIARLYDQGETGGRGVLLAVTPACTPTQKIVLVRPNTNCGRLAHFILLRAEQSDVDTVFIMFSTWWAVHPHPDFCVMADGVCQHGVPSTAEGARLVLSELAQTIATLKSQGKAVIVSLPFPLYNRSIPDLEIHNVMFADTLRPGRYDTEGFREQFRQAVLAGGGIVFDPRQVLCPGNECRYQSGGISLYRDDNHLADGQTGILEPFLAAALSAAAPAAAPGSTTAAPQGASPQSASP
jgi:hypothetical protein